MRIISVLIKGLLFAVGGIIIGIFAALLVCRIVETVYVRITRSNLGHLICEALRSSKEDRARKLLKKAIKGAVTGKTPDTVSVSLFDDNNNTAVEVKLKTTHGVDESVITGMVI